MAQDGAGNYRVFSLVKDDPLPTAPVLDLPDNTVKDCCDEFAIRALADTGSTDTYKNDVSQFTKWFDPIVTSCEIWLQKFDETTESFADLIQLTDDTYGTFNDYGYFINDQGLKFVGYILEWKEVLTVHGAGGYRIKFVATSGVLGSKSFFSWHYCLKQYTAARANGTIRVEYYINHILGDVELDERIKDFGELNWYNSLRLPGFFGYESSSYEQNRARYKSGERPFVENDQEPEYIMKLKGVPQYVHNIFRTDVMQSDDVLITDYNANNFETLTSKKVYPNSGYEPFYSEFRLQSKLAGVEVKWLQKFNNHKKLRG